VSYSLLESIPVGISHGLKMLKGYVSDLKYIFTSDGVKSLGGFGAIDETVDAFAGEICLIFMLLRLTEVSWVSWLRQDDLTVVPPVTRSS